MQEIGQPASTDGVRVSACVVNFNGGEGLVRCVASLFRQAEVGEVIVVDNASTDSSIAMLASAHPNDSRLVIVRNQENLGFAAANNIALAQARGNAFLLINPDCVAHDHSIGILLAVMESSQGAGMVGPLVINSDGSEQRGCRRRLPRFGNSLRRVLFGRRGARQGFDLAGTSLPDDPVPVEAISGAAMLVGREAVRIVGGLDDGYFLHCEDLDWCRRFMDSGFRILFAPAAVVEHQQGHSSQSRPVRVLWYKHRGMWRYFRKFEKNSASPLVGAVVCCGIFARALLLTPLVWLRILRP